MLGEWGVVSKPTGGARAGRRLLGQTVHVRPHVRLGCAEGCGRASVRCGRASPPRAAAGEPWTVTSCTCGPRRPLAPAAAQLPQPPAHREVPLVGVAARQLRELRLAAAQPLVVCALPHVPWNEPRAARQADGRLRSGTGGGAGGRALEADDASKGKTRRAQRRRRRCLASTRSRQQAGRAGWPSAFPPSQRPTRTPAAWCWAPRWTARRPPPPPLPPRPVPDTPRAVLTAAAWPQATARYTHCNSVCLCYCRHGPRLVYACFWGGQRSGFEILRLHQHPFMWRNDLRMRHAEVETDPARVQDIRSQLSQPRVSCFARGQPAAACPARPEGSCKSFQPAIRVP